MSDEEMIRSRVTLTRLIPENRFAGKLSIDPNTRRADIPAAPTHVVTRRHSTQMLQGTLLAAGSGADGAVNDTPCIIPGVTTTGC